MGSKPQRKKRTRRTEYGKPKDKRLPVYGLCPASGKRQHLKEDAEQAARQMEQRQNHYIHAYYCRDCRYWHVGHITSKRGKKKTSN